MKIQLKRSNVLDGGSAKEPTTAQMEYGELAINYESTDPTLFYKDSSNAIRNIKLGILPDLSNSSAQSGTIDDRYLNLAGGTLTGDLTGTNFIGGVCRVSSSPPTATAPGELWYNTDDGRTYVYYTDGDNDSQWVDAAPDTFALTNNFYDKTSSDARYLQVGGDTATGVINFTAAGTAIATTTGVNVGVDTTNYDQGVRIEPTVNNTEENGLVSIYFNQAAESAGRTVLQVLDQGSNDVTAKILADGAAEFDGALTVGNYSSNTAGAKIFNNNGNTGLYINGTGANARALAIYNGSGSSYVTSLNHDGSALFSSVSINGNTSWHAGNDGSGSGLDADLLDGQHGSHYLNYNNFTNTPTIPTNNNQLTNGAGYVTSADGGNAGTLDGIDSSSFLRSDANDSFTGRLTSTGSDSDWLEYNGSNTAPYIPMATNGTRNGYIQFTTTESWMYNSRQNIAITLNGSGLQYYNGSSYSYVWHSGNDGSGSGLDADNLDGYTWDSSGKNVRGTDIYADNWFRNYNSGEGMYNETNGVSWYSDSNYRMVLETGTTATSIRFSTQGDATRGYIYANSNNEIGFLNNGEQWGLRYNSADGNSPNLYWQVSGNTSWTGDTGTAEGKIEYHGNQFYIVSGSDSTNVVQFRRSSSNVGTIDNSGNLTMSGNVTAFSDITLKKNIEVIPDALDKVSEIRGVTYDRIDDEDLPRQAGVIAQEVEAVLPEVVSTNEEGVKSVAYGNLVGLLIEAVKELKAEVETLKAERN